MTMDELSLRSMKELIKTQGDKRVAADAAQNLGSEIEGQGQEIAEEAIKVARENGRKTVRSSDIKEASRRVQ